MASTTLRRAAARLLGAALLTGVLMGCQADELGYGPKHLREVSAQTKATMAKLGVETTAPVLMRIFKEENAFEVWRKDKAGRYVLVKSYEICKWSGNLGPKIREGDRQAPEGYYTITPALMNPNSQYYLAFNTGFPNAYDRSNGRTGTALMVHGACSSRGCYAMTDEQIQEIYAIARDAFRGGQRSFQLQAYPFRLTPENMARHWNDPNMPFWKMLKVGYDHFELTRMEPKVDVCGRRYVFNAKPKDGVEMSPVRDCPVLEVPEELRMAAERKAAEDEQKAMVIAQRLDGEKKAAEEREMMIAARKAEEIRVAEERRLLLQERGKALASLFGGSAEPAPAEATVAEGSVAETTATMAAAAPLPTTGPNGEPLPRRNPRVDTTALAMAPAEATQARTSSSMFSRLFSFGGEAASTDDGALAGSVATAAPTAGSDASAAVTAVVPTEPPAAAATAAVPTTAAPAAALPTGARPAAAAAAGAAPAGTTPAEAPAPAAVADATPPAPAKSSFWPFGSLF
ncbi:L,D-transpeptidase family protein [Chthonobacter rhizosphaerae]|uniref:L,D-transpeptidase family protein n=1 Tax=Chthonobacter rhizosphaerae TaxID=2735553 RepID=UPI0015EE85A8|nr:L,D-transpeptidase family protein [Chthonobacter rhizosphaerae]